MASKPNVAGVWFAAIALLACLASPALAAAGGLLYVGSRLLGKAGSP